MEQIEIEQPKEILELVEALKDLLMASFVSKIDCNLKDMIEAETYSELQSIKRNTKELLKKYSNE